jgi:sucrose synthase
MGLIENTRSCISQNRSQVYTFLRRLLEREQPFLLRTEFQAIFAEYAESTEGSVLGEGDFADMVEQVQEVALSAPWLIMSLRTSVGRWQYLAFHAEALECEERTAQEFLQFKERLVSQSPEHDPWLLELDLGPFNRDFPRLREARSIGRGVEFLNRHLSSRLFKSNGEGQNLLFEFLRIHQYQGRQLMINQLITDAEMLREAIREAIGFLKGVDVETRWQDIYPKLGGLGFEPGWGDKAALVKESLQLLSDILEAPDHQRLEEFLARIPMIFEVAIISPHGYFGQDQVLGKPDTGGQVVYILNQVVAMEKEMRSRIRSSGLDAEPRIVVVTRLIPETMDTACNIDREKIVGTQNAYILRVPFHDSEGKVLPHWVSRFKIYPYLEQFSLEVEKALLGYFHKKPDLIIGNYTDGNLVASLLSRRMQVTQCNIAHALEKTKYLYSALYWRDLEHEYHFSCQFTADLIAMNTADFIVSSTYQEIAGDEKIPGQYESYSTFTMPGLYRVINGIDVFDPKFNIVSPGADPKVFFPYTQDQDRFNELASELEKIIYGEPDGSTRGRLEHDKRPIIFSMSRLDKVKNLPGLTWAYANNPRLRELAKLVIVGGHTNPDDSQDAEELDQIHAMHRIMDEHQLDQDMRWLGMQLDKNMSGEIYRVVADQGGVFVQPAMYEAFGLTVVEAMVSGLPAFATCYGGPSEIIEHGVSGFHIDPGNLESMSQQLVDFFKNCQEEPDYWQKISKSGIKRVKERYNWDLYAQRLMTLARVYGFWKYATNLERQETQRYLEMFYDLMLRKRAQMINSN